MILSSQIKTDSNIEKYNQIIDKIFNKIINRKSPFYWEYNFYYKLEESHKIKLIYGKTYFQNGNLHRLDFLIEDLCYIIYKSKYHIFPNKSCLYHYLDKDKEFILSHLFLDFKTFLNIKEIRVQLTDKNRISYSELLHLIY